MVTPRNRITRLTNEWTQYNIPLRNADLSSVIGGFCWAANVNANPNGLTFYLDDIKFVTTLNETQGQ